MTLVSLLELILIKTAGHSEIKVRNTVAKPMRIQGHGSSSVLKNLEIGALAVFLPWGLGQSGCCEQTLTSTPNSALAASCSR